MYYATQDEFGLTFSQVRRLFPQASLREGVPLDMPGVRSYAPTPLPEYDPTTHAVREIAPQGGVQRWQVYPLSAEDVAEQTAMLKTNLLRRVTELRWEHETGGITLPGDISIGTSIEDQNRITTVIANAQLAGVQTVDFKASNGWVTLTLAQVQGIAAAIALHVQACFSAERAHHEAIAPLSSPTELQAYDPESGWPA